MTILALEFSSPQRSAAVARGASVLSETIETSGRGAAAFGMVETVLREAKIEREQVDALAVGLGPGSYTGIRGAIAIAQGWQLARDVRLVGVSSAEAIAAQAQAQAIFGRVNVAIDAQRGEVYLARFDVSETAVAVAEPLQIWSPDKIQARSPETFVGPEAAKWFPSGRIIFPGASAIARLTARRNNFVAGESLTPIYLRETAFVKVSETKS
jgi:tRNA threonylcarbamoyladenosine biosynthesis protein TsaB